MHQSTHGDSPMTTARRAGWRPGPGSPTVRGSDPTIRHGHNSRCMCGRHWRRPRTGGHGDMLHRCPHTLPDADPVTTRAAGLDRAVRRQLDTGKHAARCSPATPCSTHVADARIGAYGRSPLANRSASQPRRVGDRGDCQRSGTAVALAVRSSRPSPAGPSPEQGGSRPANRKSGLVTADDRSGPATTGLICGSTVSAPVAVARRSHGRGRPRL